MKILDNTTFDVYLKVILAEARQIQHLRTIQPNQDPGRWGDISKCLETIVDYAKDASCYSDSKFDVQSDY